MSASLTDHEQAPILDPSGIELTLDCNVIEVVKMLWARDLTTFWSCEGTVRFWSTNHPANMAYVAFEWDEAGERLFNAMREIHPAFKRIRDFYLIEETNGAAIVGKRYILETATLADERRLIIRWDPRETEKFIHWLKEN